MQGALALTSVSTKKKEQGLPPTTYLKINCSDKKS